MFALAADQNNKDIGLWEDVCGASNGACSTQAPVFGKQIGIANALETGTGVIAGASHTLWLAAIPSANDTLLFAGTQDVFRCSLTAGCAWRNATNVNSCATTTQVGPNQHGVAWVANTATLFFANDRGLWRTRDAIDQQQAPCSANDATHFDNLNATLGSLAEVTWLAQDPEDVESVARWHRGRGNGGRQRWCVAVAAERAGSIHRRGLGTNAGTWFATSGAGVSISSCASGATGASCRPADFGSAPVIGNAQVSGDGSTLMTPAVWALDPEDPKRMLVATCRLWRGAADGTNWNPANALSRMLDGTTRRPASRATRRCARWRRAEPSRAVAIRPSGSISGWRARAMERLRTPVMCGQHW
jgi:hypothetical protein